MSKQYQLENFERAFSTNSGSCRRTCECGVIYYNPEPGAWTWEEGELEALETNPKAISVGYAIGGVIVDGTEYADACSCWHKKAERIIDWLDNYTPHLKKWYELERQRLQALIDQQPTIEDK